jgi:hypothetical protein
VLALGTAAALMFWWLLNAPPRWYQPPDVNDPAVARLADDVEHRLLEELHRIRPGDDVWTLRIREEHINAWLAARMRKWLMFEHGLDWPTTLGTPQVRVRETGIDLAVPVRRGSSTRTMTLRLVPEVIGDHIALRPEAIRIGRVPMPWRGGDLDRVRAEWVQFAGRISIAESQISDVKSHSDDVAFTAEVPLAGGRSVTLIAVRTGRGTLDLTTRTSSPPSH